MPSKPHGNIIPYLAGLYLTISRQSRGFSWGTLLPQLTSGTHMSLPATRTFTRAIHGGTLAHHHHWLPLSAMPYTMRIYALHQAQPHHALPPWGVFVQRITSEQKYRSSLPFRGECLRTHKPCHHHQTRHNKFDESPPNIMTPFMLSTLIGKALKLVGGKK